MIRLLARLAALGACVAAVAWVTQVWLPRVRANAALVRAVAASDVEQVKALLRAGADPNARNEYGETALIVSVQRPTGGLMIPLLLVEAGAEVNVRDRSGEPALLLACRNSKPANLLLEAGADPNANTASGEPILTCVLKEVPHLAGSLMESGARVECRDREGVSAVVLALKAGADALALRMLEQGADPRAVGTDGVTALMLACGLGDRPIPYHSDHGRPRLRRLVPRLLRAGLDVNAKSRDGHTALMWATTSGNVRLVRQLISTGANVQAADADGHTALMRAEGMGHWKIARLLRKAGARR